MWQTDDEAACFVDVPSIVSADLYWFTDPWQVDMTGRPWLPEGERPMTLSEIRRASNYGYAIDRLRALDARDGQRKPIWAFVETGWPFTQTAAQGARAIEPREVRAAVWHSLIAGARGVIYFNHSFGGPHDCQTQHVLRNDTGCYGAIRAMVTSIDSQIKALAPALNADTVTSGWTVGPAARAMVKWYDGHFYVFTAARAATGGTATFSLPCAGDATAVRLYEGGTIPMVGGQFSETFVGRRCRPSLPDRRRDLLRAGARGEPRRRSRSTGWRRRTRRAGRDAGLAGAHRPCAQGAAARGQARAGARDVPRGVLGAQPADDPARAAPGHAGRRCAPVRPGPQPARPASHAR